MSENKHAPEPMFQYQFSQLATYENGRTPVLLTEAQYCRAKSCIDACAGMTSEQVSHGIVSASVFSSVVQQRDELLAENEQLRKDAERYRVLRDSEYQLDEDDPSVSDSFFNQYFGEELDAAVDELKSRFDSAIASVK